MLVYYQKFKARYDVYDKLSTIFYIICPLYPKYSEKLLVQNKLSVNDDIWGINVKIFGENWGNMLKKEWFLPNLVWRKLCDCDQQRKLDQGTRLMPCAWYKLWEEKRSKLVTEKVHIGPCGHLVSFWVIFKVKRENIKNWYFGDF